MEASPWEQVANIITGSPVIPLPLPTLSFCCIYNGRNKKYLIDCLTPSPPLFILPVSTRRASCQSGKTLCRAGPAKHCAVPVLQNTVPCRSGKTLCSAGTQGTKEWTRPQDRTVKAVTVRQNPVLCATHTAGGRGLGMVSHMHGYWSMQLWGEGGI
jgi:hypothetical protein